MRRARYGSYNFIQMEVYIWLKPNLGKLSDASGRGTKKTYLSGRSVHCCIRAFILDLGLHSCVYTFAVSRSSVTTLYNQGKAAGRQLQ